MSTLFWEHRHKLLKGAQWLAKHKVDFDFVAFDEIGREGSVMERVEPVPALTPLIVVRHYPLEALDV